MKKTNLWSKRLAAVALSTSMVLGSTLPALADNGNQGTPSGAGEEGVQSVVEQAKTVSSVTCSDADEAEAEVAGEYYRNFEDAVEAAMESRDEVILLKSVDDVGKIEIDGVLHLVLDETNITFAENSHFFVTTGGYLHISGEGVIQEKPNRENFGPIMMKGSKDHAGAMTAGLKIEDDITLKGWSGLFIRENGSASYGVQVEMEGTTIESVNDYAGGVGAGVYVNGTISEEEYEIPFISLENVNITSTGHGIFCAGNAEIEITGGTIIGEDTGVEMRDGSINLCGTTITSTRESAELKLGEGNGTAVYGAGFAAYPHSGRTVEATLEDCIVTGYYPIYEGISDDVSVELSEVTLQLPKTSERTLFTYAENNILIDKGDNVTFDMNNNEFHIPTDNYFYVNGGKLTITNGLLRETEYDYAPVKMVGSTSGDWEDEEYSVVNVEGDAYLYGWAGVYLGDKDRPADYGMVLNVKGKINGNDDKARNPGAAIYVNGYVGTKTGVGPEINILDGALIDSSGHGIFQAGYAITTVSGDATVMGDETGIEVRAGELVVMDGDEEDDIPYILGNSPTFSCYPNGNGSSTIGAGIAVVQHTTGQPIEVTIKGGEIVGHHALYQASPETFSKEPDSVEMEVSGGHFRTLSYEGSQSVYSEDLKSFLYGGTYSTEPDSKYLADNYYTTMEEGNWLVTTGLYIEDTQDTYFVDKTGATGLALEIMEELENNDILYTFDLKSLADAFDLDALEEKEYEEWIAPSARKLQFGLMYDVKAIEGKDITSNGKEIFAVKKIKVNVVPYLRQIAEDGILYFDSNGWNTDEKGDCDFRLDKKASWFTDTFRAVFPIPSSYPSDMVNVKLNDESIGGVRVRDEDGNRVIEISNMPGGVSEIVINFEDVYEEDPKPVVPPTTVTIVEGETLSTFVGERVILNAEADGDNARIIWTTSNDRVATIDENGIVTILEKGRVTITATIEGTDIKDTIVITVEKHGLTLAVADLLVGTSATVEVVGDYSKVVWSSADTAVATVDQKGNITAVGVGTTKITAVVNGIVELSCTVNVADMTVAGTQGNTDVSVSDEQIAQKQEAAANNAVADVVVPENVDETEFKKEVTKVVKEEVANVVDTVKSEIGGNTVATQPNENLAAAAEAVLKSQELEENEKALVYVNIVLEDVAVDVTTKVEEDNSVKAEAVPTKLTFKIEPFVKVFDADGNVKKEAEKIANKDLNGSFKVRIPIPSTMAEKFTYATIDHISNEYGTKTYTLPIKEENGQFYVEMTLTHFSTFEVSFTNTYPSSGRGNGGGSSTSKKPAPAVTGTWVQDSIGWWYRNADGTWPAAQWIQLDWNGQKTWYYFDANGYMHSGWLLDGGYWYFLHNVSDGTMGRMLTGWQQIDGKWYYFNPNVGGPQGSLLVNTVTPDGYTVDANGVWVQ